MTQKPKTPESPVTEGKGQFVQFPVHLIYGNPHLTRDDKWVLLALMGKCWEIGPHRLSYREIAKIADVPVSLLSTYTDKQGRQHEGILDRIVRVTGYLQVVRGKEIDPLTEKPRKQVQTYIYVDYPRIWRDNLTYCQVRNTSQLTEVSDDLYNVYRLIDPRNNDVYYVGITNDLERRYKEHIACSGTNLRKNTRTIEILQQGLRPLIEVIEPATGLQAAKQREGYWISHYRETGKPLTNSEGVAA